MRIIVSCVPQTGHVVPLLPLAGAFAAQGDDVVVATGPDGEEAVISRGLSFRAVGPPFGDWFGALRARTRGTPGDGLPPERVTSYFLPRLFGEIGTALVVDDLLALVGELHPDLLVFDPLSFAGPLVAAVTGVRTVLHTIGPLIDPQVLDLVADAVSPIWREFGLDVPPTAGLHGSTTLTICPPSLDPASAVLPSAQPLRPVPLPLAEPPPLSVALPDPELPVVYVTLGTFSNSDIGVFRLVLDALADEPVNVLATIGRDNDPVTLAPAPRNARIERFIPQAEVLPHCTGAVHHAGAGTTFGVLAHGLPSLAMPRSADNFVIADRLAAARVAATIRPDELTETAVRAGVRAIRADSGYRERARQVGNEIAAMPSPAEVARTLAGR